MHTIRIVQKGMDTYNGDFGGVVFENGVSIKPYDNIQVDRIAGSIMCVDDETGEQLGIQHRLIAGRCATLAEHKQTLAATPEQVAKVNEVNAPAPPPPSIFYTDEDLFGIAEKSGIKGLREIGDKLGVRGRAIPELMASIQRAQDGLKAAQRETERVEEAANAAAATAALQANVHGQGPDTDGGPNPDYVAPEKTAEG